MIGGRLTFPLVSRRRLIGLAFGSMHGARRGSGSDIAGSRPYVPGDDPHRIDWGASARLSAARASDEFVVREYLADEAPRVVVCLDRRPGMSLCPPGLPFLHKAEAADVAVALIEASVAESRGLVGRLEHEKPGVVGWSPPASGRTNVVLAEPPKPIGGNGRHLSMRLRQHNVTLRAVAFGGGEWAGQIEGVAGPLNIAFRPKINTFAGRSTVELQVLDWQPAERAASLSIA